MTLHSDAVFEIHPHPTSPGYTVRGPGILFWLSRSTLDDAQRTVDKLARGMTSEVRIYDAVGEITSRANPHSLHLA